jgi:hypothetical protein
MSTSVKVPPTSTAKLYGISLLSWKLSGFRFQASDFWWVVKVLIVHATPCKLSLRMSHAGRPFLFASDRYT